jgi:hypothetical protein
MITFALMRQDHTDKKCRDLIASGTITTLMDMQTGNYSVCTGTIADLGGITDISITPNGVAQLGVVPSVVVTGSFLSSSNNFYSGTIKLVMEPQVTSHILRTVVSGSSAIFTPQICNATEKITSVYGAAFGSIARRSSKYIESGRSVLGNNFALLTSAEVAQSSNPIHVMDSQYENLTQKITAPYVFRGKTYLDVVSKTTKSPYILYPQDKLLLCLSKHRAAGTDTAILTSAVYADVFRIYNDPSGPSGLYAYHDVAIGTGSIKLTLYGDLIREDVEFHDTLNQRLETEELWQDVGEDPVLDQFDVSYRTELSGSYIDRFSVLKALSNINIGQQTLSSSVETTRLYSNFAEINNKNNSWSTQYEWSSTRSAADLKSSLRHCQLASNNEKFWDTRIPYPKDMMSICNPSYRLAEFGLSGFNTFVTGQYDIIGILDLIMTYPYESRFSNAKFTFANSLIEDVFPGNISKISYGKLTFQYGANGFLASEGGLSVTGLTLPEFIKFFYGIGAGYNSWDNQHVIFLRKTSTAVGAELRGWRHGMMSAFPLYSKAVFNRNHYGHPRDMLEQRLDAKFFDEVGLSSDGNPGSATGVKDGPVQVKFYDQSGKITDGLKTLSSNLSYEATSSMPYADGLARNRPTYDFSQLNIANVVI